MWNTFLQAQQWESHTDTEAWSRGYVVTHPPTHLPTYLFWEHLWGAILDTCDLSDIWPEWWGDCIFSNCFFQTDRTNAWPTWFLQPQSFNVPAHLFSLRLPQISDHNVSMTSIQRPLMISSKLCEFISLSLFSCPQQLNRWPCHSVSH